LQIDRGGTKAYGSCRGERATGGAGDRIRGGPKRADLVDVGVKKNDLPRKRSPAGGGGRKAKVSRTAGGKNKRNVAALELSGAN